jgi:hypothetical protein
VAFNKRKELGKVMSLLDEGLRNNSVKQTIKLMKRISQVLPSAVSKCMNDDEKFGL